MGLSVNTIRYVRLFITFLLLASVSSCKDCGGKGDYPPRRGEFPRHLPPIGPV